MKKTENIQIINKMCGICGFNWEDKKLVSDMSSIIAHRGPDQHGIYVDKDISLGHLRLSIIDLSIKGKQPMQNEDGTIQIVYNGEIYNYLNMREKLKKKGHKFNSNTDTEVIIHAYEEYGTKCIEQFNGMFAFAVWDSKNKTIFIARDRIGIKPLYYYFDKKKFIFASEIKSILQDNQIKREINEVGLKQLFLYAHNINGETLFKNIKELLPGHYLVFKNNTINIKKYWCLNTKENIEKVSYRKLTKLLEDSVNKRLLSDVPLGATLSGGIDSSIIVAFMSKLRQEPPKTFTLGIEDYDDDFNMSRIVSEHCETEHVEKSVGYEDITKNIPKILWHMEYPYGRPAVLLSYFTAKEIKPRMTVSLIGDGADEIFAGYNRYLDCNEITSPEKIHYILSGYFNSKMPLNNFVHNRLNINKFRENELNNIFQKYFKNKKHLLNQNLLMDTELEIPGIQLSRVDKMSMAFSVEMRVPFLDHTLSEYCINLDPMLKINKERKKYMLQQVALKLLPKETALRKKLPFGFPLVYYFKNGFIDIVDNIFDKKVGIKDYINLDKVKQTIKMAKSGKTKEDNSFRQLLFLTNLELFHKMFIENDKINSPNLDINSFI